MAPATLRPEGRGGRRARGDRPPRAQSGVGAAIVTGYKRAIAEEMDVTAVMAADGQMDPDDLETLVHAIATGECDYAKANRLFTGQAWDLIPRTRYLRNAALSLFTKIASGYWHVADSQSGYTAVSLEALSLDLDRLYPRYGFPNDMLVHLNVEPPCATIHRGRSTGWGASDPALEGRPDDLVAPLQGLLLAARLRAMWIRRLPSARPLLGARDSLFLAGVVLGFVEVAPPRRQCHPVRDDRPCGAPCHLRPAAPALRHVVRHGVQQGAPVSASLPPHATLRYDLVRRRLSHLGIERESVSRSARARAPLTRGLRARAVKST